MRLRFQPTRPQKGQEKRAQDISTHLPMKGGTSNPCGKISWHINFNPPAREGRDCYWVRCWESARRFQPTRP